VCGDSGQFKTLSSSQPHKGGVKNVFQYFSFDKATIFLVKKKSKNDKKKTQNKKDLQFNNDRK
jgi:hypothetical protein